MNSSQSGTGSSSWNDQEKFSAESNMHYQRRRRYTPRQAQILEENFAANSHPDETQCQNIARESGITPLQVKFWFQNKRTSTKAVTRRIENKILRKENERIRFENQFFRRRLVGRHCANCGPVRCMEGHNLLSENFNLKQAMFQVQDFLRENGVDPTAPLDPPYEVISNAPLGENLWSGTPEQNVDSSFPPQHDGMIPTPAQGGGNEVNSIVPHVGNFWNPTLEWNPIALAGSNGADPTAFFDGNILDSIALLPGNVGESTSLYDVNAWNPNQIPTVAPFIPPPYLDTEFGEIPNTEEKVDSFTGEANLP